MVTKAIIDALGAFIGFLLGLLPSFSLPSWVDTIHDYAVDGVTFANGFKAWVPLTALRNAFVFLLAVGTAAFIVRGSRVVISLFSGGGGSAG